MKERPIIFDDHGVRAILAGNKTQTRRVVEPQPIILDSGGAWYPEGDRPRARHYANGEHLRRGLPVDFAPYQPGDRLCVLHEWWHNPPPSTNPFNDYAWDEWTRCVRWKTGETFPDRQPDLAGGGWQKRTAMEMPRWASRITLEVVSVRVERVQEISEKDARAEGFPGGPEYPLAWFADRWDTTNKKRGHGWDANPWVWVVEFGRVPQGVAKK